MSRIRTIKPEFSQSESIGRLSRDARLLFIELWTVADDEGRCRAASRMLASTLFPYDGDAQHLIDGWLKELEAEQCIRLYEVDGSHYLAITNWHKHQKIDRPSTSRLPPPSEHSTPREPSRQFVETSRVLDADLDLDLDLDQDRGKDQGPGKDRSRAVARSLPADWPSDYFEQFWAAWPNRVDKKQARRKLTAIARQGAVRWADLMSGVQHYIDTKPPDRNWMGPVVFLNGERWTDEPAPIAAPQRNSYGTPLVDYDAMGERIAKKEAHVEH